MEKRSRNTLIIIIIIITMLWFLKFQGVASSGSHLVLSDVESGRDTL